MAWWQHSPTAHGRGVVHRDLKPSNVRVDLDGTVCVLDWGLARLLDEPSGAGGETALLPALTRVGARIGTPAYMSPEQAAGEEVGPRADVWSLGILLWEVVAGRRAYEGRAATEVLAGVLSGPPPDLRTIGVEVPDRVADVVVHALGPLAQRLDDADALLVALDEALTELETPAAPRSRWQLPAVGLTIALATAAVGVGAVSLSRTTPEAAAPVLYQAALVEALLEAGDRPGAGGHRVRGAGHTSPTTRWRRAHWSRPCRSSSWCGSSRPPPARSATRCGWYGAALACASADQLALFEIDLTGIRERWRRDEEVHQLAFGGTTTLLAQAPRAPAPQRMRLDDGSPLPPQSSLLKPARLLESRTERVARGPARVARPAKSSSTPSWKPPRCTPPSPPAPSRWTGRPLQIIVLSDGHDLRLMPDAVVRADLAEPEAQTEWTLPPEEGAASRMALSTIRAVRARTDGAGAGCPSWTRRRGTWSPWAEMDLAGAHNLAVSPDGQTAAASRRARVTVWPVAAPSAWQRVPVPGSVMAFLDDRHLVATSLHSTSVVAHAGGPRRQPAARTGDAGRNGLGRGGPGRLGAW